MSQKDGTKPLVQLDLRRSAATLEFSRAIAFACFTVTKWLMVILGVLFAALALQAALDDASRDPVSLFVLCSAAALALAGLMHWLAMRISS
jgi:type IV secretory pathway TrbD component